MRAHVKTFYKVFDNRAEKNKEQPEEEKEVAAGGKGSVNFKDDVVPSVKGLSDLSLEYPSPL